MSVTLYLLAAFVVNALASSKIPALQKSENRILSPFVLTGSNGPSSLSAVGSFPTSPAYMVYEKYTSGSCSTLSYVDSIVLNTCLSSTGSVPGSGKYVCNPATGVVTFTSYSGTTCAGSAASTTVITSTCDVSTSMKLLACNTTTPLSYFSDGKYTVLNAYQNTGCTQLLGATGIRNGACYIGFLSSFMYKWPNYIEYSGSNSCSGSSTSIDLDARGCAASGNDDDYVLDNSYTDYSYLQVGDGDDDDTATLSKGAVIGIIIGSVVGFLLIVAGIAVCCYFCCCNKQAGQPSYAQPGVEVPSKV